MPVLSIIVPIYNVELYLSRCLDSLLSQTFSDYELILIDDGSIDHSPEIMEKYAERDKRIITVHQINQGVSAARNAGLNLAKGEYIMFCDSDDSVATVWAERMLAAARQNKWSLILCNSSRVSADEQDKSNTIIERCYDTSAFFDFFTEQPVGAVWNKIFRAAVIRENHIFFDLNYSYGEDKLFVLTYLLYSEVPFNACCIGSNLYNYNPATNNSLTKQFNVKRNDFLDAEKNLMRQLGMKYNIPGEQIERYLKLKRNIATIESIRKETQAYSFPKSLWRLRGLVRSDEYKEAVLNPDIRKKTSCSFYHVLRTRCVLLIYFYDFMGRHFR